MDVQKFASYAVVIDWYIILYAVLSNFYQNISRVGIKCSEAVHILLHGRFWSQNVPRKKVGEKRCAVVVRMSKRLADMKFGKQSEEVMIHFLNAFYGEEHHKETLPNGEVDEYDRHDFWNASRSAKRELKTRRICHTQYPTALINQSKITHQDPNVKYTYIWKYTDGVFYLDYDKTLWDTFNVKKNHTVYRDGRYEIQPVIEVPSTLLKAMTI